MKSQWSFSLVLLAGLTPATLLRAEEPYLDFVQGLRDRQYYDYAILYLDQIGGRPNVPAEIKQVIPYQKAMILLDGSKTARTPEKQTEQLDQALAYLEQFVKESPGHPSAADANSDRAQILLGKARVEIVQSKSPANQGTKRDFQAKAREYLAQARQVFQTAYDQHEANFKKYPTFIEEQKDPQQYAARAKVEVNLITALLNLGMCTYEEAQTHDAGSNEFKQLLNKAADEFEKMHQRYRSQVGGLYARAWQGKCYEEQNDIQKAMGIYNELLDHPGDNAALTQLKSQALYFKLICLNGKDRNDQQLVVDLVEEWLKKNQSESRTRIGLGIQWEQARAYEALGDKQKEVVKADAERAWRQARTVAQQINRFPGEYKDVSLAMTQRVTAKLGGKERKPDDFETAYGLATQSFNLGMDIKKELDGAIKTKRPADEITKLQKDWTNEINDAGKNYELALALATKRDEAKSVSDARLRFAYVNFWQRKNYEAAVLAQFVARTVDKDEGTVGLDSAYLAMAAFVQAFNDNKAPLEQKGADMQLIIRACNLITDRWPASDKSNEARMMLGRMYSSARKPAEAAQWFEKVPEPAAQYPEAQTAAGQAYWTAYLNAPRMVGADKPTPEQLGEWLKLSQQYLRNGITKLAAPLPKEGAAPPELIAAKMSLSQIVITQGQDAEALKLLLDDPQSVVKAVTVADESKRPDSGVQSRKFATEVYKLILRAYIGTSNLDKARETMKTLEAIAGAGGPVGGADVTQLYVDLGKQLKEELERFRSAGETEKVNKLMTSFETFLNDMASRKDGQTFGSLSWIGETYFALGETVASDAAKSTAFYDKAGQAFGEILTKTAADPNFASADQLFGVKLRQVRVLRFKKEFETAETLITDVLTQRPNDLKVQITVSELYQDWGFSGQADSPNKLLTAIRGNDKIGAWGWSQTSVKLQKSKEFATNPIYTESFLDARYNGTLTRQRYARDLGPKEKQKELDRCVMELIATSTVTKSMSDERYAKFNQIYREVLQEAGKSVADLPRSADVPPPEPVAQKPVEDADTAASKKSEKSKAAAAKPTPKPAESGYTGLIVFVVLLLIGGGVVGWVMLKGGKLKLKSAALTSTKSTESVSMEPMSFEGVATDESLVNPTFVAPLGAAPKPKPKPRPATAPGTAGTKPASKPAAPGTAPSAKPRPKPPAPPSGT